MAFNLHASPYVVASNQARLMMYAPGASAEPAAKCSREDAKRKLLGLKPKLKDDYSYVDATSQASGYGQEDDGQTSQQQHHGGSYPSFAELLLKEHEAQLAQYAGDEQAMIKGLKEIVKNHHYQTFLAAVRLEQDDGESLLIDTGASGGLSGDEWFESHIAKVMAAGLQLDQGSV